VNKIIRYIQNYLICALPFVIACMVWETIQPDIQFGTSSSIMVKVLWEVLSWNLMLWFVFLILFLISLVAISSVREKTLRRLANLHERDEREQYITGKAARAAYISTLSFLILFLFLSMVSLRIASVPKNQVGTNGHHTQVNIGIHFSLLDKHTDEIINQTPDEKIFFDSNTIKPSISTILLFLFCWQLLIFNLTARKELG
jgi:hypothetical protein